MFAFQNFGDPSVCEVSSVKPFTSGFRAGACGCCSIAHQTGATYTYPYIHACMNIYIHVHADILYPECPLGAFLVAMHFDFAGPASRPPSALDATRCLLGTGSSLPLTAFIVD